MAESTRADARRNRERVLIAARESFAESGFAVPLDEIAIRFDPASQAAKEKAAQAAALHAQGNHAEAEKVAQAGLKDLGM